jgi:outer membrane protein
MDMSFRVAFVLLAAVTAGSVPVSAQEPLTLEAAVRTALDNNADLQAARAGAQASAANADAARAAFLPRLSVSQSWQRGDVPGFVFGSLLSSRTFSAGDFAIDALNHPSPLNFFHTSVTAEQVLFDGRISAGARAADEQRRMAEASAAEAAASVAVAVTRTYGRIVAGEADARAAEVAAAAAREDIQHAEARRDAGTATDADVLSLSVHLASMQQQAIRARGDADIARAELNRLMGEPVDHPFAVTEPSPVVEDADAPLSQLLAEAENARPELVRAKAAEAAAASERSIARASLLPTAGVQAGYELDGTAFDRQASGWLVGGEVRWTLSAGGAETARLRAATEAATAARARAADARASVQVDVVTALRGLQAARAREAVARAAVAQAQESQRIIRDRFDAGLAPVEDLLRASTAVVDAEASRVGAVVDASVSAAALGRALGRNP